MPPNLALFTSHPAAVLFYDLFQLTTFKLSGVASMNTVVPTIEAVATRVRIRSREFPLDPGFTQAMI